MIGAALILASVLAGSAPVEYDCVAEKQILLMSDEGKWSYNAGDVARDQRDVFKWKFIVRPGDEEGSLTVSHDPGIMDAVGVGGEYDAIPLAPGQFAFSTSKEGNCLFTELGCGAMVEISDINAKKASFSLVPMGSVKQQDDTREIFQMVMLGTCKKAEVKQ